jgi:WD40 repeat protein
MGPDRHPPTPPAADRVGEYDLLGEVGRGGMGVVYRARHRVLNRPAAVKMILAGRFASEPDRHRFRLEAELAARVRHPNVVPVYEVGEHDGCPFLAMEWVAGGSLADRLDDRPWPAAAAAELVEAVALAVQAAHDEGVVHRDLKPANILLRNAECGMRNVESRASDVDSAFRIPHSAIPKVADFGLARAADGPGLTRTGVAAGTPEYMAPEQAAGGGAAVGPAADVYALGVILYRLLTGRTPFAGADPLAVLAAVADREPPRPRRLSPAVPRDLEAVCLKCLEKRPHRRYESARELAADLARFRAGRAVTARRVGAAARLSRWARRHPGTAGLLTALAAAIAVGFGLVTWKWREADGLRQVADDRRADAEASAAAAAARRREARRNLYVANVRLAKRAVDTAQLGHARELLDEAAAGEPGDDDLRGWEWHYLHRPAHPAARTVAPYPAGSARMAVAGDGRLVATAGPDGVRVTAVADGREVFAVRPPPGPGVVAFSADGGRFAAVLGEVVQLWDARTWRPTEPVRPGRPPARLAVRPGGRHLATAAPDGEVEVWEVDTGRRVFAARPAPGQSTRGLAYSPDGRRLAVACRDAVVRVCEAETGAVLAAGPAGLAYPDMRDQPLAFTPDGRAVVTVRPDRGLQFVEADSGRVVRVLPGSPAESVFGLAAGPGGVLVVAAQNVVHVRDAGTGRTRVTLRGHTGIVLDVAVTPDGQVITGSADGTVVAWEPAGSAASVPLGPGGLLARAVAFSPDGRRVAGGAADAGPTRVWEADAGRELFAVPGHGGRTTGAAFSPDGRRLVTAGRDATARVWDAADGRPLLALAGHAGPVNGVAVSPDGRWIATGGEDRTARLWEAATGRPARVLAAGSPVSCLAFGPGGRHLAAAGADGIVRAWEVESGEPGVALPAGCGAIAAIAYRADGRQLAVVGGSGAVVWDPAAGRRLFALPGLPSEAWNVAYTPDGRRVVTTGKDGTLRVWDAADGRELLALGTAGESACGLAVSPDGRRVATGGPPFRLWEAFPLPPELLVRRRLAD